MIRKKYCGTAAKAGGNGENKPHPKIMGVPYLLEKILCFCCTVVCLLSPINPAFSQEQKPPAATDKPLPPPGKTFQFVVLPDVHTGNKPGRIEVLEKAVKLTNTLQPSFVITVGDLIIGKDPKKKGRPKDTKASDELLNMQWNEFNQLIDPLQAKFYFVPGHSDFNYAEKAAVYKARVGSPYYSFNYGGCHFLIINTSDKPNHPQRRAGLYPIPFGYKL